MVTCDKYYWYLNRIRPATCQQFVMSIMWKAKGSWMIKFLINTVVLYVLLRKDSDVRFECWSTMIMLKCDGLRRNRIVLLLRCDGSEGPSNIAKFSIITFLSNHPKSRRVRFWRWRSHSNKEKYQNSNEQFKTGKFLSIGGGFYFFLG